MIPRRAKVANRFQLLAKKKISQHNGFIMGLIPRRIDKRNRTMSRQLSQLTDLVSMLP
jgi:hypothetical protein